MRSGGQAKAAHTFHRPLLACVFSLMWPAFSKLENFSNLGMFLYFKHMLPILF